MIETKTIEEVTEALIDYRGKTPEKTRSGVVLITAKVIKDGRILDENNEYVSEANYDSWMRRGLPKLGDILITTEAPLGEVAQLKKTKKVALAQRVILLRGNPKIIYQDFYFHALRSPFVKGELMKRATGTTVLGIKQSELRKVKIPYFTLPIQRRIATILSAYDDLIETNTRRIQILEEMARRIYEEWFVRFRFPGHENVRMVGSELGLIPDSWEVKNLRLLIKRLTAGNIYRDSDISSEGGVIVVDQSTSECLGFHNNQPDHRADPEHPIIIFGDHTCKLQVMITPFSLGANTVPLVANDETTVYYLYNLIRGLVTTQEYKRHWTELNSKTVIKASSKLCVQYDELVKPFFAAIDVFRSKNRNLRRTRDLLLPKLISGEIDVSNFPEPVSD